MLCGALSYSRHSSAAYISDPIWVRTQTYARKATFDMSHQRGRIRSLAGVLVCIALIISTTALGEVDSTSLPTSALGDQIVKRMMESNEKRAQALQHYTEDRHYQVEYSGFLGNIAASMEVEVTYNAPSSKSFRILSQTGSKLLIDHVLKKLLESEREAAKALGQNALTPENYTFTMVGNEVVADQKLYLFQVEPRVNHRFLYRGRIWVDAKDYAVVKIEAEPADNPSFWIKRAEIRHTYSKTGDLWLPERNRSESTVRMGGTAILTIDYGAYQIQVAHS